MLHLGGNFSPDIADVQKVAMGILRHRLIKNYKAEAEGLSIEDYNYKFVIDN